MFKKYSCESDIEPNKRTSVPLNFYSKSISTNHILSNCFFAVFMIRTLTEKGYFTVNKISNILRKELQQIQY